METLFQTYWPFGLAILLHFLAAYMAVCIKNREMVGFKKYWDYDHQQKYSTLFILVGFITLYLASLAFFEMPSFYDGSDYIKIAYYLSLVVALISLIFAYGIKLLETIKDLGWEGVALWAGVSICLSIVGSIASMHLGFTEEFSIAQACVGSGVCMSARLTLG